MAKRCGWHSAIVSARFRQVHNCGHYTAQRILPFSQDSAWRQAEFISCYLLVSTMIRVRNKKVLEVNAKTTRELPYFLLQRTERGLLF
jgi:hypothetical protein